MHSDFDNTLTESIFSLEILIYAGTDILQFCTQTNAKVYLTSTDSVIHHGSRHLEGDEASTRRVVMDVEERLNFDPAECFLQSSSHFTSSSKFSGKMIRMEL